MVTGARFVLLALVLALGGCPAPAPEPAAPARPADLDVAALVHTWTIRDHVLGERSVLTDEDARALHGRKVEIGRTSFTSPWQGHCDEYGRTRHARVLADLAADLELSARGRAAAIAFGLDADLVEYRLACADLATTAPPLTLYVAGARAMTCFNRVCYLLAR